MEIRELHLVTSNLALQRDFYIHALSLTASIATPERLTVQIGTSQLTFTQAALDAPQRYHFAINVPPQQFADAKAWIARRVALLTDHTGADEFYFEAWNAHALYFADPAGNIVELIARHTLASQSPPPFTAQSLLCVSEIGLATDNVLATVDLLCTRLGVSRYQGAGSDDFTAVGDESGLFIVVKRGRIWFPDTNKPAEMAPASVEIATGSTRASVAGPPYQVMLL